MSLRTTPLTKILPPFSHVFSATKRKRKHTHKPLKKKKKTQETVERSSEEENHKSEITFTSPTVMWIMKMKVKAVERESEESLNGDLGLSVEEGRGLERGD